MEYCQENIVNTVLRQRRTGRLSLPVIQGKEGRGRVVPMSVSPTAGLREAGSKHMWWFLILDWRLSKGERNKHLSQIQCIHAFGF